MAGIAVRYPDYATLSKLMKMLDLNLKPLHKKKDTKFSCIAMDSTGIQTYTGNEWLENKHGNNIIVRHGRSFTSL